MRTEIYHFSGTGNSLAAARDIAGELEGKLIPIGSVIKNDVIETDAPLLGIVFPVYFASLGGSGLPAIVDDFVRKLIIPASTRIFAIATHRGGPFSTIENLNDLLRKNGSKLSGGFTVQLSLPFSAGEKLMNVFFGSPLVVDQEKEKQAMERLTQQWEIKKGEIVDYVKAGKTGHLETTGPFSKFLLKPWMALQYRMGRARYRHLAGMDQVPFSDLIRFSDSGFKVSSDCIGCGTCARVCPVKNIRMVDNKPLWLHHCESCYACFQWCHQDAIGGEMPKYEKKYHHPAVTLADMLH